MLDQNLKKTRLELGIVFLLYVFLLPKASMELDMGYWQDWALKIHHVGLAHAYDTSINYFPVFLYGLWIFDLLQGTDANIIAHIASIKLLFVFFDFLPLFVLCGFRKKLLDFKIPYLFLILNIAYVFNSMIWGQIDSMYTNLSFLSLVTALVNPVWGAFCYILALNTKAQAIVFLPVVLMAFWYRIRTRSAFVATIGTAIALQTVLLLPFFSTGGLAQLWYHVTHSVDLYQNLSISAFNIWHLITSGNPYVIDDHSTYFLLSYKTYGLFLFGLSSVSVLWPLFKYIGQSKKIKLAPDARFYEMLFLGCGLLCLFFFYFNSQMHERYAHPIIILFFFYGVVSGNYRLYVLASLPYLLSLDKCFAYPDGYLPMYHYKFIYASKIIALWYTATVIYGGFLYFRLCRESTSAKPEVIN